jgi:hypothetical protein
MAARLTRIAGATAAAAVGLALMTGAASAETAYNDCRAGGDILTGWTEYNLASQNTVYVTKAGFHIERNNRTHNNVYMALRGNGGDRTFWMWESKDDIVGGRTYERKVEHRVPQGAKPYMKYHATFDQDGSDPTCAAYSHLR